MSACIKFIKNQHNIESVTTPRKELETEFVADFIPNNLKFERKIILVIGAPGSGKSTYIKKQYKNGYAVFDSDQVIFKHPLWKKYGKETSNSNSNQLNLINCISNRISNIEAKHQIDLLQQGANIIKQLNNPKTALSYSEYIRKFEPDYEIAFVWVHVPLKIAIERANKRKNEVGFLLTSDFIKTRYVTQLHEFTHLSVIPGLNIRVYDGVKQNYIKNWKIVSTRNGMYLSKNKSTLKKHIKYKYNI